MQDLIGRTLGHYRVVEKIGAGGMGVVYRAQDERLDRDVAIKVLPEDLAQDPERLARFEREAKLLASLSHQNIAALHGLEEHEGQQFLVMELAEGETLADRIIRGTVPVNDALDYARQIAEGLEAAHEKGIIHRDLKPANVMVSPEGKVKILDFGLAKAWYPESSDVGFYESPTLTAGMTRTGVLLGTAAYMSPEQARGKQVDKRADVWAFGCVLYEMLTRQKAFRGNDASQVMAAILKDEPDWNELPGGTPLTIRRLLRRCLRKNPNQRLHDIADARIDIETVGEGEDTTPIAKEKPGWSPSVLAGTAIALVALGITAGAFGVRWFEQIAPEPLVAVRVETTEPLSENVGDQFIAVSPDGRHLAFVVADGLNRHLIHRPLDRFEAVAIPGSEGATGPFFSPDSRWVGFSARGNLKKVSLDGGPPVDLCEGCGGAATWSPNGDEILFTGWLSTDSSLKRVSAAGGEVSIVREPDTDQQRYDRPAFLPDGRAVLLQVCQGSGFGTCSISVLDLETNEIEVLVSLGTDPAFSPSGHLLFAREDELFAVAFDASRRRCAGNPVRVLQGISSIGGAASQYGVSRQGLLAFVELSQPSWEVRGRLLVWVDRTGGASPMSGRRDSFGRPSLSPDGKRVAVRTVERESVSQIAVFETGTATWTSLTTGGGWKNHAVWTPDGRRIVYSIGGSSAPGWLYKIFSLPSDFSSDQAVRFVDHETNAWPYSFAPSGDLVFAEYTQAERGNILRFPAEGGVDQYVVRTPFHEYEGMVSPNGHWLAYTSNRSGMDEVYVEPFPGGGPRTQVSDGGGSFPRWSPRGNELFYLNGSEMIAAPVTAESDFAIAGERQILFESDAYVSDLGYDVDRNGQRFLMVQKGAQDELELRSRQHINLILNWFSELDRLVPRD